MSKATGGSELFPKYTGAELGSSLICEGEYGAKRGLWALCEGGRSLVRSSWSSQMAVTSSKGMVSDDPG
jgi:hypothetical protein